MNIVELNQFLKLRLPEVEKILPWMNTQSLNMVYAWRGVGKTHFALGVAYAIATGGRFLNWEVTRPRKVLYLDGEMSANSMQDRLREISKDNLESNPDGCFRLLTPDLQNDLLPDLSSESGQKIIDNIILDSEVIIVDNISSWVRGVGRENEAESWIPIQQWALKHRRLGRSILFIHHSGKNGNQRGTSKREDILDTVICLKRPVDYKKEDGCVFELHFEKSRHISVKLSVISYV